MNSSSSLIDGFGNEMLFLISFVCTILFFIFAWISTRVNWELWPVQISQLGYLSNQPDFTSLTDFENSGTNNLNEDITNTNDVTISSDSSESCSEDIPVLDNFVRKRNICMKILMLIICCPIVFVF